ncbi:MAG: protein tyrosine phosphatase [Alphaproteobacteria bacterium]|nr:protein tyrosine phosphatase [Alphaproteobacteria bacterium]
MAAEPNLRAWLESRAPIEEGLLRSEPWRVDTSTAWRRFRTLIDMYAVDHGVFRTLYANRHRISGRMWRASQPAPYQLAGAARLGVKTIINLRGARASGTYVLEREACERLGLTLVNFSLGSREAPRREALLGAAELFRLIEYPALMHCKSGADRVGFMSALYLALQEGRPVPEAMRQLSLRYGHVRQGKTGILDLFFETYLAETKDTAASLLEWITNDYDQKRLTDSFHETWWGGLLVDRILRRE